VVHLHYSPPVRPELTSPARLAAAQASGLAVANRPIRPVGLPTCAPVALAAAPQQKNVLNSIGGGVAEGPCVFNAGISPCQELCVILQRPTAMVAAAPETQQGFVDASGKRQKSR